MRLATLIHQARVNARDALELVLVPALAAVLPWPLCFRIFRSLAGHCSWLYRASCESALREAHARGWVPDDQQGQWLARRRLVTLVDHADMYLSATRSDAWMARHLKVTGAWPAAHEAGIFCTFHWGAGMWGLRHAGMAGMQAHALVAALDGAHFAGRPVLHWYARRRTAMVAQALQGPVLDVSASLRPALRALRNNEQVMAAIDVPSDQVAASIPVRIAGMDALVPKALLRLAVEQKVPVSIYLTGLDANTGQRFLSIEPLGPFEDLDALAHAVFERLDAAIRADSAAWHFWSEASRFFSHAEQTSK